MKVHLTALIDGSRNAALKELFDNVQKGLSFTSFKDLTGMDSVKNVCYS